MPTNCPLKNIYQHELTGTVRILHGLEDKWSPYLRTIDVNSGWVKAVSFSPDGIHVASASQDKAIRIWDVRTGELQMVLDGQQTVESVVFLSQGPVVSGSIDGIVNVWDPETGELRHTHKGRMMRGIPSGTMYVAMDNSGTVNVWDVTTGLPKTFPGTPRLYQQRVFGAIWDGSQPAESLQSALENSISSALSQDRTLVAFGKAYSAVEIWDVATEKLKITCEGPQYVWILSVSFTPDGTYVVGSGTDIYIWDVSTGALEATLHGHTKQIRFSAFSPDGQHLVSGSDDRTIKIWDFNLRSQDNGCAESV
jgi:WD40 repeat protein